MTKLALCLWFDTDGEAAANYYVDMFRDMGREAAIKSLSRYGAHGPMPEGQVMTVNFTLDGMDLMALNGGPHYSHTHAASLMVQCANQAEIDGFWDRLLDGGQAVQCGWVTDRFGVSWQVVPDNLDKLINVGDPAKSARVMEAMMGMVKLDIAAFEKAAAG